MNKFRFLIALCALAFTGKNIQAQKDEQIVDQIIAVVGENIVLFSEIETQAEQMRAQGATPDQQLRCKLLEEVLLKKLLLHKGQLDSVEVSDTQIQDELNRRMNYFVQQAGSEKMLEDLYGKTMEQIKAELYDLLKEQMMAQQVQSSIASEVKVTPSEVRTFFYAIPPDSLPYINSTIEAAQIVIKPKVTQQTMEQFRASMLKIRNDITVKGRSFKTMAILHSKDGSAQKGGDLGWMTRQELVPEFAAAAFALKPGEVSGMVETEFGYHLIQLIERRGESIRCSHILMYPETGPEEEAAAIGKLDSIRKVIQTDTLTFEQAAKLFSDDQDTRNNRGIISNPANGSTRFDMEQIDPQLFFAIDRLKTGNISEPVKFETRKGSAFRIVKLNNRTQPHVANLSDDYDLVRTATLNDKRSKMMDDWVTNMIGKTYIKVDPMFTGCELTYGWIKKKQ